MATHQASVSRSQQPVDQLKDSIRDMVQVQRDYQLSDELFWEVFDARVLLNENINIHEFLKGTSTSA